MKRTATRTFVVFTAVLLFVLLTAAMGHAAERTPTLHPQAVPLPFTHQGPFVTAADGFDAPVLACYNETVRKLAAELAVPLVDVHEAFTAKNVDKLLLDGMHPNDAGHQLITDLLVPILREWLP